MFGALTRPLITLANIVCQIRVIRPTLAGVGWVHIRHRPTNPSHCGANGTKHQENIYNQLHFGWTLTKRFEMRLIRCVAHRSKIQVRLWVYENSYRAVSRAQCGVGRGPTWSWTYKKTWLQSWSNGIFNLAYRSTALNLSPSQQSRSNLGMAWMYFSPSDNLLRLWPHRIWNEFQLNRLRGKEVRK